MDPHSLEFMPFYGKDCRLRVPRITQLLSDGPCSPSPCSKGSENKGHKLQEEMMAEKS